MNTMNNLNFKNNLENPEILSKELFEVIELIITNCPNVVFGGSIALNAVGLLNRKISDIDLFFHYNESLTNNSLLFIENIEDGEILSDTVTDVNGKEIQRTGIRIKGIKICAFKVDNEELQHSEIELFGKKIKIQNVNYAIQAKIAYSKKNNNKNNEYKKNNKHEVDLNSIDYILNQLPF
jgi:hypothetical protein